MVIDFIYWLDGSQTLIDIMMCISVLIQ